MGSSSESHGTWDQNFTLNNQAPQGDPGVGRMGEFSEPTCSKCRWHKPALTPGGTRVGLDLDRPFYGGGGEGYTAIGAVYCEHETQPRGLVLTNYTCRNFERPPELDMRGQLSGTARSYEDMLP